jgi:hypothetical protein
MFEDGVSAFLPFDFFPDFVCLCKFVSFSVF